MGTLKKSKSGDQSQERLDGLDIEAAAIVPAPECCRGRKRKTSQNTNSHGSFFLRVGAIGELFSVISRDLKKGKIVGLTVLYNSQCVYINLEIHRHKSITIFPAFGLATMIYNGLEFGAFFEIPFHSSCYQILRGVNPLLQMIFTFMQMYFIFMNSRVSTVPYFSH